jgi:N-glycosylase/DNA lyase
VRIASIMCSSSSNVAACADAGAPACRTVLAAPDYDLAATLNSGQVFRWVFRNDAWEGVIGRRTVRLRPAAGGLLAETTGPENRWDWLADYLQSGVDLEAVLATFPDDAPMRAAVAGCRGLRLLRQDPWECLASFILSSTKQIVQIRQLIARLCERYGEPLPGWDGGRSMNSFPAPERLARCREAELRACKLGFRAPYLLATARRVAEGGIDLSGLSRLPLAEARFELMTLPGVGRKIADCVLLFAGGFASAFPVDVWIDKALRELYFSGRRVSADRLRHFAETHFGPNAGYAQQYLFHYMRTRQPARTVPS